MEPRLRHGQSNMHPYDIMIIISIACVVGFTGVIYVDKDLKLALLLIAAAAIGCPLGAWVFWRFVPIHDQFAVIFGGFAGGTILSLYAHWLRRGH